MEPPPFGYGNLREILPQLAETQLASMEPPPFGDGNPFDEDLDGEFRYQLQWSHRLSAMETFQNAVMDLSVIADASMEPPPFGDGNNEGHRQDRRRLPRFNGATAFRRWKRDRRQPVHGGHPGFNEATAFRRWKPRERRRRRRDRSRFNGATAFRRWKRRSISLPRKTRWRFNGATAFRRWKQGFFPLSPSKYPLHASMEPPPFGDGNREGCPWAACRSQRFNGATAFGDGNLRRRTRH